MSGSPNGCRDEAELIPALTDDFIGMMSHELYTPLSSIIGMANQLASGDLNDEQRECLDQLRINGNVLREVIEDVFDYAHIASGKCVLEIKEANLHEVLEGVVHTHYSNIPFAKPVSLSLRIAETIPQMAKFDSDRLRQVLSHLIENALKFTERGSVDIVAIMEGRNLDQTRFRLRIEVRDTGGGIPPEQIGKVFRPFTQLDASRSRAHEGAGLGLAISQRLAQLMGGKIEIKESTPRGSVFCFVAELERVNNRVPRLRIERERVSPYARVLVVDDHSINRRLARHVLSDMGITADEAANGKECLDMHNRSAYELIFMDIQMPKIDGIETTRLIRKAERERGLEKKARIVALTAHTLNGLRQNLLEAGMDDCLSKPLTRTDLESILFQEPGDRCRNGF